MAEFRENPIFQTEVKLQSQFQQVTFIQCICQRVIEDICSVIKKGVLKENKLLSL